MSSQKIKCSLSGSLGTNQSTCPLNDKAKNPDPEKHPLTKKRFVLPQQLSEST